MLKPLHGQDRLCDLVGLPDFLVPWVDRFYEPREIELVQLLDGDELEAPAVKNRWAARPGNDGPREVGAFLDRSYKRGVVDRDDRGRYRAADFHTRFDIWALFEGWQDIPGDIRDRLNRWELTFYEERHKDHVEDLRKSRPRDTTRRWPEYLLLHEAEALVDAVSHVYLRPCNCRSMLGRCTKSRYTCLLFSNDRGLGWEISKHRAKAIVREANRRGLMQSGEIAVMPDGRVGGALCNCCADCCFPHLLAKDLGAEKLWPLTRYRVAVDRDACTACGRCIRRCPFNAIALHQTETRGEGAAIRVDHDLCRGCGVCSTGCKEAAISMVKTEDVDSLFDRLAL